MLEIVTKTEVNTQSELIKVLEDQGLKVTQATVSRDIKELGLVKIAGKSKKYRYAKPMTHTGGDLDVLIRHFKTAILSVSLAQNLVVFRTLSGNANSIGALFDSMNVEGVIGSIAGDDTLLVICPDNEVARIVKEETERIFDI